MQSTTEDSNLEKIKKKQEAKRIRLLKKRKRHMKKSNIQKTRSMDRDKKNAFSVQMFKEMHDEQESEQESAKKSEQESAKK